MAVNFRMSKPIFGYSNRERCQDDRDFIVIVNNTDMVLEHSSNSEGKCK